MADEALKVQGLPEFRKGLKDTTNPKAYQREFRKEEREIAKEVAQTARANATAGPFSHFAGYIIGKSTNQGAAVGLRSKDANATFWGAKKHTGWYAQGKYADSTGRQHPEWVGASWEVGGPGGPYAINPAIRTMAPQIVDRYGEATERVASKAFPPTGGEKF